MMTPNLIRYPTASGIVIPIGDVQPFPEHVCHQDTSRGRGIQRVVGRNGRRANGATGGAVFVRGGMNRFAVAPSLRWNASEEASRHRGLTLGTSSASMPKGAPRTRSCGSVAASLFQIS